MTLHSQSISLSTTSNTRQENGQGPVPKSCTLGRQPTRIGEPVIQSFKQRRECGQQLAPAPARVRAPSRG